MTAGLAVRDLSFSYGAKQALQSVSFDVPPARFCALLGPNGPGKSTLVSLMTRLLVAPSGDISIAGQDLREVRKHPECGERGEEILSMIWDIEEEIMGRTEDAT